MLPLRSGQSRSLAHEVNVLRTERNFFNSYRFCCAAFILVLLFVLSITTCTVFLSLSMFHSVPKIGNYRTLVDDLQIDIRGSHDILNYRKNMPGPNKTEDGIFSVSGICRVRILLGNPFDGRMKIGNVTGTISLGTDDSAHELAKFTLQGIDAIDPGSFGEHAVHVTFKFSKDHLPGGISEILQHTLSTASRKIGVSVHIEFRDIWIDLWFSKRWSLGFDISGVFYLDNDLGIEMLGLCPSAARLWEMDFANILCIEYWADMCAPCVHCSLSGNQYHCDAVADESLCQRTCRNIQHVEGVERTTLESADVTGINCEEDYDSWITSNRKLQERRNGTWRHLEQLKNHRPREEHFATYYQKVRHHYRKDQCREEAVSAWLWWFQKKMEHSFVGTLTDDLEKGKLPLMPSNPSGTLFYHFFLPMILVATYMFTLACCVCARVFGAHKYYLYSGRQRVRKKEEDSLYMERFGQRHPEFTAAPASRVTSVDYGHQNPGSISCRRSDVQL